MRSNYNLEVLVFDGTANHLDISPVILNSYLTFNEVCTKRGKGWPSLWPTSGQIFKTSVRVEQVASVKLLTRLSTSEGTKLWKCNILQHSALKHHISRCLRRHNPR